MQMSSMLITFKGKSWCRRKRLLHFVHISFSIERKSWTVNNGNHNRQLQALGGISKTVQLRRKYPGLKVLVGFKNWILGSTDFRDMLADPVKRAKFISSVDEYVKFFGVDGINMNWEIPSVSEDRSNVWKFLQELRKMLTARKSMLSMSVSAYPPNVGVDGRALAKYADFLNILSHNYNLLDRVQPGAPIYSSDDFNINHTIHRHVTLGVPPSILNLGLSAEPIVFKLKDEKNIIRGSLIEEEANSASLTDVSIEGYNDLCSGLRSGQWKEAWDKKSQTPIARNGKYVVSFENEKSYEAKIRFAMQYGLGGVSFFAIHKDDFEGKCQQGHFPLLKSIQQAITQHKYDDIKYLLSKENANYFWNKLPSS